MPTYRDEVIVLRSYQLGEADRIITFLSRNTGKIRAVARGVRRTSSKFGARLEPFNHIDAQLAVGRGNLDIVAQVESIHSFQFGLEYAKFTAAEVLVETADKLIIEEKQPTLQQFRLLLGALLALDKGTSAGLLPIGVLVDSYQLRALAIAGYRIAITQCAKCGSSSQLDWFSQVNGGVICSHCHTGAAAKINEDIRKYLGKLLSGDWQDITKVNPDIIKRSSGLVASYVSWYLERNLSSLPFLER